jgi:diguanylate cyclase (GGDEF)-like protein
LIDSAFGDQAGDRAQDDLRPQVASALMQRADVLADDAAAVFQFTGEPLDQEYCRRIGHALVELLASAVRDGRVDPRGGPMTDVRRLALDRSLPIDRLFAMMYLTERTAIDDLATDEGIGATAEAWPVVAQLVRRASFDVLAGFSHRAQLEPTHPEAVIDPLTTLYTRPVLDAVLAKSVHRAGRYGERLSLILFDVDDLAAINAAHGYGVGDRILERLGILVRGFFRQYDWVARHGEDSIAVLLSRTEPDQAVALAEKVCGTVAERLELVDHRDGTPVQVTVSAGVVNVRGVDGETLDAERLMADAEAAVERAKRAGRNRVERVDGYSGR